MPPADPLIGISVCGRYTIKRFLTEGRTARIYEAVHESLRSRCVLKVLRTELVGDLGAERRFLNEAKLVSRLRIRDPRTVSAIDFVTLDGKSSPHHPIVVFEKVEGRTIEELLRSGPLPPEQAASIAAEIAGCLQAAHTAGIAHRGLRASEVMLVEQGDERGMVKVLDWGAAEESASAPEHAAACSADQQAVGRLLQQMLGDTEEANRASSPMPTLPAWLTAVIQRATAARPEHQFPSLEALSLALQKKSAKPEPRLEAVLRFCPSCGSQRIDTKRPGSPGTGTCTECGIAFGLLRG